MDQATQYNFEDFTLRNYRRYVQLAKQRYPFLTFDQIDREGKDRFVLWRHDIDFSIWNALRLAQIEAVEGVTSTFFLHLHNHFYNVLEREASDIVSQLISLGHAIGLHFDADYYRVNHEDQLQGLLQREARILEELFGRKVAVFSFHNPTPAVLSWREWTYAGMINTYASYFRSGVGYCSDSNGIWRHRRLENVLLEAKEERLQILTHPVWWTDEAMPPRQRIQDCIDRLAARLGERYDQARARDGRENIH